MAIAFPTLFAVTIAAVLRIEAARDWDEAGEATRSDSPADD